MERAPSWCGTTGTEVLKISSRTVHVHNEIVAVGAGSCGVGWRRGGREFG
jgi:hypothetical protein